MSEQEKMVRLETLKKALKSDKDLLKRWSADPAQVLLEFEVADKKEEVDVKFTTSSQASLAATSIANTTKMIPGIKTIDQSNIHDILTGQKELAPGRPGSGVMACASACILLVEFSYEE